MDERRRKGLEGGKRKGEQLRHEEEGKRKWEGPEREGGEGVGGLKEWKGLDGAGAKEREGF